MWSQEKYSSRAPQPLVKDLVSFSFSSLREIALRFRFKFVQAISGAEMQQTAFVVLRVALAGFHRHPAHRIFAGSGIRSGSAVPFMATMSVDHVRAATETHHQVKQARVN
jgi:hypothetical protein